MLLRVAALLAQKRVCCIVKKWVFENEVVVAFGIGATRDLLCIHSWQQKRISFSEYRRKRVRAAWRATFTPLCTFVLRHGARSKRCLSLEFLYAAPCFRFLCPNKTKLFGHTKIVLHRIHLRLIRSPWLFLLFSFHTHQVSIYIIKIVHR